MEKYRVTLSAEERAALERLISRGKAAARKLTHGASFCWPTTRRAGDAPMKRSSRP
jgi:hypothetical protein